MAPFQTPRHTHATERSRWIASRLPGVVSAQSAPIYAEKEAESTVADQRSKGSDRWPFLDLARKQPSSRTTTTFIPKSSRSSAMPAVLLSPYLQPSPNFINEIKEAITKNGVGVSIVVRADKAEEYSNQPWFHELGSSRMFLGTVENLHSKLYASEKAAILTSMNLTSTSKDNSLDIGIRVDSGSQLFKDIWAFIEAIGPKVCPLGMSSSSLCTRSRSPGQAGVCIVCARSIPLDRNHPYCSDHWRGDPEGRFCRVCAPSARTARDKPACFSCLSAGALDSPQWRWPARRAPPRSPDRREPSRLGPRVRAQRRRAPVRNRPGARRASPRRGRPEVAAHPVESARTAEATFLHDPAHASAPSLRNALSSGHAVSVPAARPFHRGYRSGLVRLPLVEGNPGSSRRGQFLVAQDQVSPETAGPRRASVLPPEEAGLRHCRVRLLRGIHAPRPPSRLAALRLEKRGSSRWM